MIFQLSKQNWFNLGNQSAGEVTTATERFAHLQLFNTAAAVIIGLAFYAVLLSAR